VATSLYKCVPYSTCGTLIKSCTVPTFVFTISSNPETLTASTTAQAPCAYCNSHPLIASSTSPIAIADIPYSTLPTTTDIITKAVLEAKFTVTDSVMEEFCPLYTCTGNPTGTNVVLSNLYFDKLTANNDVKAGHTFPVSVLSCRNSVSTATVALVNLSTF
jgi:hypothetical protein